MTDAGSKPLKQVILEVLVALFGSALVIGLNLLTLVILEPDTISTYKSDPGRFKSLLAVQFDVAVIAATLLIGAGLSVSTPQRGKLFWSFVVLLAGIVILLILAVLAAVFDAWHPDALRYGIPDLLSLVLLFVAIRSVVKART